MPVLFSNSEKERITAAALKVMREWDRPIILDFDITTAVGLIGQLQLAFRHPANNGPTRQKLEKIVRDLIDKIDPDRGDMHKFLCMGFEERYDE